MESSIEKENTTSDFEYEDIKGGIEITGYKGNGENVVVPNIIENKKVVSISGEAFSGNVTINSLTLPENIERLSIGELSGCDNLTYLELRNKNPKIQTTPDAKSNSSIEELSLPNAVRIDSSTINCLNCLKRINAPNCTYICSAIPASVTEITLKAKPLYAKMSLYVLCIDAVNNYYAERYDECRYNEAEGPYYIDRYSCEALVCEGDSDEIREFNQNYYEEAKFHETDIYYHTELNNENISKYVCSTFNRNEIKINGVTYKSDELIEQFRNKRFKASAN